MSKKRRFEKQKDMLVTRMRTAINSLKEGIQMGSNEPPFSVKLTEQEQLEQYAAMDQQKWQQMVQTYGVKGAMEYSEEMQKLWRKHFPETRPEILMVPNQDPSTMPQQGHQPPVDETAQIEQQGTQMLDEMLAGVGLNRGMLGG
jgi:hypothetical protein